jgi:hypothetical protein
LKVVVCAQQEDHLAVAVVRSFLNQGAHGRTRWREFTLAEKNGQGEIWKGRVHSGRKGSRGSCGTNLTEYPHSTEVEVIIASNQYPSPVDWLVASVPWGCENFTSHLKRASRATGNLPMSSGRQLVIRKTLPPRGPRRIQAAANHLAAEITPSQI